MHPSAVSSILKTGMVVSTKLESAIPWLANTIYKCEGDIVAVSLIDSYLHNLVLPGTGIVLKYSNEYFEYLFTGNITGISPAFPSHLLIRIHKAEEFINTRTHTRYDIYLPSSIKQIFGESSSFAVVINVGLGGMALVSKEHLDLGEEFEAIVYLHNNLQTAVKCKVVRKISKSHFNEYSSQFLEICDSDKEIFIDFIESLEQGHQKLENYFYEAIEKHL